MAVCKFCEVETCDTWYSSYCAACHKIKRIIALFGIEKVSNILDTVLLVDFDSQKNKVKVLLKEELSERVCKLIEKKEKKHRKLETIEEKIEETNENDKLTKM
tara:strand:- start:706 stop:1014 length:309 start_codon:yes stop_codon:yes gene_type:complete